MLRIRSKKISMCMYISVYCIYIERENDEFLCRTGFPFSTVQSKRSNVLQDLTLSKTLEVKLLLSSIIE